MASVRLPVSYFAFTLNIIEKSPLPSLTKLIMFYLSLCFTSFVIAHFDRMTDTPAGLAGGGFFIRSSLCDRAA